MSFNLVNYKNLLIMGPNNSKQHKREPNVSNQSKIDSKVNQSRMELSNNEAKNEPNNSIKEHAKLMIQEMDDSGIPRSGLYCSASSAPVSLPLVHADYQASILNNVCEITLEQEYVNNSDTNLELDYYFPIEPNATILGFKAKFADVEIVGVVKEKSKAKQDYEVALKEGRQVAYGEVNEKTRDVMMLRIGNVDKGMKVKITINFMQMLDVVLNMFWQLNIQSIVWPRYFNEKSLNPETKSLGITKATFTWTFKVLLKTSKACIFYNSPTHKLQELSKTAHQLVLVLPQSQIPSGDFTFLFSTESFDEPVIVGGKTDSSHSCIISFIPKFSPLSIAESVPLLATPKATFETDMDHVKGEYVFLLDRSGSMDGTRINKAKEALVYFLRSLPQDSYFNVISFGSGTELLFPQNQKYADQTLKDAVAKIQGFDANLGGTQIAEPLMLALTSEPRKGYPRNVFLLTDGEVGDTEAIVQLCADNCGHCRVHGIGIGDGASKALIKGSAEKGKGKSIFLADHQNVAGKIVELLQATISPVISEFNLSYAPEAVDTIIPNPGSLPFILKNEPVSFYILLSASAPLPTCFTLAYTDSVTNSTHSSSVLLTGDEPTSAFVDKMVHHERISQLLQRGKLNLLSKEEVKDRNQEAIDESVRQQVLCDLTAFVCVGNKLADDKYQEFVMKKVTTQKQLEQQQQNLHIQPHSYSPKMYRNMEIEEDECCDMMPAQAMCCYDMQFTSQEVKCKEECEPAMNQVYSNFTYEKYEEPSKPEPTALVTDYQKIDGSWDQTVKPTLFLNLNLKEDKFIELLKDLSGNSILLLTILTVHYLVTKQNTPQNMLIIKKGKDWIKKTCKKLGLGEDTMDKTIQKL